MAHEWREHPGFKPPAKLSADTAAQELDRIREQCGGKLMPRDVVAESKPKTAPLHHCFEWRDATAGELYREHQARNLIRSIRVVTEGASTLPKFVHVRPQAKAEPAYYQDARTALESVDEWTAAVSGLEAKLSQAKKALDDLARIAGEHGRPEATVLVVIAKAFATIDNAIGSLRN